MEEEFDIEKDITEFAKNRLRRWKYPAKKWDLYQLLEEKLAQIKILELEVEEINEIITGTQAINFNLLWIYIGLSY